jgi:hypothetical protein
MTFMCFTSLFFYEELNLSVCGFLYYVFCFCVIKVFVGGETQGCVC